MNDRLAFLRAIRANPDDDTTRLVFADWLDEHDDPLGEFIRVQIELEPIRYRIDNPRARELRAREEELLRQHGDDWLGDAQYLTGPEEFGPVLRRGLPDYACLSLDTFLTNGEALFTAYPTLREVALYGLANRCDELTLCPLLARLDTLEIADWPTQDDVSALAVSPHIKKIPRFKLWVGGAPWLLRQLVAHSNTNWPREIELVQVYGGAACLNPAVAQRLNAETDWHVRYANESLGRIAVRVSRPFEQLFPFDGKLRDHMRAGTLPDGSPALVVGGFQTWILVSFNNDGRVSELTIRDSPVTARGFRSYAEAQLALSSAFEDWVEELRLVSGMIWVREFNVENLRVELWPGYIRDQIADPAPEPPVGRTTEREWRERGGNGRSWLEKRNFLVDWSTEHWADWRGQIHSS